MRNAQKTILATLAALTLAAFAAVIFTWQWADYRARLRAIRSNVRHQESLVDTRALDTAEQLSQLAESRREKGYAQEALRLADYSVDAAFTAALQDAAQNPAPLTASDEANHRASEGGRSNCNGQPGARCAIDPADCQSERENEGEPSTTA